MRPELDEAAAPLAIEKRSFEIIDAELPEPRPFQGTLWEIARRCIHALGDVSIIDDLRLDERSLEAGLTALKKGCRIYADTRMLAAGLVARRMRPLGIGVSTIMELPALADRARDAGMTRARCGMKLLSDEWAGHIVAIGNAPTALIALLEELENMPEERWPALIIGMPVGFVNAAQSKAWLAAGPWPSMTLLGRKGGSAAAAACINAMAELVLRKKGLHASQNW